MGPTSEWHFCCEPELASRLTPDVQLAANLTVLNIYFLVTDMVSDREYARYIYPFIPDLAFPPAKVMDHSTAFQHISSVYRLTG